MKPQGYHIGAHVWTPAGWGYIRTSPSNDLYTIDMDDGSVKSFFRVDIIPETFWEFLAKRPGNVGAWRRIDFLAVQFGIIGGFGVCIATFSDFGWVGIPLLSIIEGLIYYGMRRNWKGKQA